MGTHYSESEPEPLSPLYAGICDADGCPHDATHGLGRMRLCRQHAEQEAWIRCRADAERDELGELAAGRRD